MKESLSIPPAPSLDPIEGKELPKLNRRRMQRVCMAIATQMLLYTLFSLVLFANEPTENLAAGMAPGEREKSLHCTDDRQITEEILLPSSSTDPRIEHFLRCSTMTAANMTVAKSSEGNGANPISPLAHTSSFRQHSFRQQLVALKPSKKNHVSSMRASASAGGAAIMVTKGVGTPDGVGCPKAETITVTAGTTVIYCYEVTNIGSVTLTHHTVVDGQFGTILTNQVYTLNPIPQPHSSVLFTIPQKILESTTGIVTWTATTVNSISGTVTGVDITAVATDSATVFVPSIEMTATVGIDPDECAQSTSIYVPSGEVVYRCLTVKNIGRSTLTLHEATEGLTKADGTLLFDNRVYALKPQQQINSMALGLIMSETVTQTVHKSFVWRTATDLASIYATATATSAVKIPLPRIAFSKTVGTKPDGCATTTEITVLANTPITYCYRVINSGDVPLAVQTVVDSELGTLISKTPLLLQPAQSGEFTIRRVVTETMNSSATWYANTAPELLATGQIITVSDKSETIVNVIPLADVTAIVFNDSNQNQKLDETETGLPDAEVILTSTSGYTATGRTNSSGTITFFALEPGLYTLTINSKSLGDFNVPTTGNVPFRIAVASGEKGVEYFGFTRGRYRTLLPLVAKE